MPIDEAAALIAERAALYDTLRSLEAEQWDQPSLCEGWRVRDVASHVHTAVTINPLRFIGGLIVNRGDFNAFMAGYCRKLGDRPVAEIMASWDRVKDSSKIPPSSKPAQIAMDAFVHHHDIAIPLGREVPTDPERLRWIADAMVAAGKPNNSATRIAGLRLVATDIDWHHGTGPEVRGPAVALIMAGLGRTAVHDQLEGEGLEVLARRS